MADKKYVERVVYHRLFRYNDADGNTQLAQRGDTIKVDEETAKRGDDLGVFKTDKEEISGQGELTTLTPENTDEEVLAWVKAAKVTEVSDYLSDNPGEAARILDAETKAQGKKGPRPGVVKAAEVSASANNS